MTCFMLVDFSHLYITMLDKVLKSEFTLFAFLFLTALLGWVTPYVVKTLGKKYSPLTLGVVDAVVVVLTLFIGSLVIGGENVGEVVGDMQKMSPYEYAQLISLGVVGTAVGLAGTAIIQHHNIGKFQLHDYIVTILVSAIGVFIFMRDEMSLQKVIGLMIIATGGFIFSN
jgi:drug/metabolite transporter (DMT)-like permease